VAASTPGGSACAAAGRWAGCASTTCGRWTTPGTPLYDLDDSDAALFAPGFRESLRALRDEPRGPFGGHYEAFLDLLARDSETPGDILAGLVDGLSEANYLRARLLVNNPAVRADRGLLVRLANLPVQPPVHDGRDLFQDVREQAAAAAALLP